MTRETLEHCQIPIYALLLILGMLAGIGFPEYAQGTAASLSPLLALLLYSMFTQIPFIPLQSIPGQRRFVAALLTANFIIVPAVVYVLLLLFPQPAPVWIGVCLVLLTPCIDYVIVFTQLGKGNEKLMLLSTPLLFIIQMLLLPLYLWLFAGREIGSIVQMQPFVNAFFGLILVPLLLAVLTQLWARRRPTGRRLLNGAGWLPVPMMALVLFFIAISQTDKLLQDWQTVAGVLPIYISFAIIMPLIGKLTAHVFRLDRRAGRTLIFSSSTRNSLVVLPLALSLPPDWALVASSVIVTQTMVELIAELLYIRLIPHLLLRDQPVPQTE